MSSLEVGKLYLGSTETRFLKNGSREEVWNYDKSNAAGGIGVKHGFYNASTKIMKYITFVYIPYNSVGDAVTDKKSGKIEARGKLTGPINPNSELLVSWSVLWYNPTIVSVKLKEIFIQYMDDSEETIDEKDIVDMQDKASTYYREVLIPNKIFEQLYGERWKRPKKKDVVTSCSAVFSEFKDDENLLLKVLDKVIDKIKHSSGVESGAFEKGYIIGDYIEKEFSSNEKFVKSAVLLWKEAIGHHNKCVGPGSPLLQKIERRKLVKKYVEKIRRYDSEYIEPQWSNK